MCYAKLSWTRPSLWDHHAPKFNLRSQTVHHQPSHCNLVSGNLKHVMTLLDNGRQIVGVCAAVTSQTSQQQQHAYVSIASWLCSLCFIFEGNYSFATTVYNICFLFFYGYIVKLWNTYHIYIHPNKAHRVQLNRFWPTADAQELWMSIVVLLLNRLLDIHVI